MPRIIDFEPTGCELSARWLTFYGPCPITPDFEDLRCSLLGDTARIKGMPYRIVSVDFSDMLWVGPRKGDMIGLVVEALH